MEEEVNYYQLLKMVQDMFQRRGKLFMVHTWESSRTNGHEVQYIISLDRKVVVRKHVFYTTFPSLLQEQRSLTEMLAECICNGVFHFDKLSDEIIANNNTIHSSRAMMPVYAESNVIGGPKRII